MKRGIDFTSVLATIVVVCSMFGLVSCSEEEEITTQDIALMRGIVGKWKTYSINGEPGITNKKRVITYNNDGTVSSTTFANEKWESSSSNKYYLNGSSYIEVNSSYAIKGVIASISEEELTYSNLFSNEGYQCQNMVSHKIKTDYSKAILGLWEGVEMTGKSTHGTSDHRWEYRADGSYTYYTKDAEGNWVADASNSGNEYYVDGDFLGTRWISNNKEYREWWDIETCNDTEMVWSALRKGSNGKVFSTKMKMVRIK